MKPPTQVPSKWRDYFADVYVPSDRVVMVRGGEPRRDLKRVWRCRRCGQELAPNTAGGKSHLAKHVREKLSVTR